MKRRGFLKRGVQSAVTVATGTVAAGTRGTAMADNAPSSNAASIPRRAYGDTGEELSIIGLGGLLVAGPEQADADRLVAEAVERGVNYFDVAPTYGNAEVRLGPALEPYRGDAFLACKTTKREREPAEIEFNQSLERLRTGHFDLYQLHGITSVEEDVDPVFAKGGVMDMLIEAKKQGQVRHVGFSAHTHEAALAAMDRYDFDSVLFPINFAAHYKGHFGPPIVAKAQEKGVARLALKALARQTWPEKDPARREYRKCWYQPLTDLDEAALGLRWTLSQPVTAAIPPGIESLFRMAMDIASQFTPITPEEETQLETLAETLDPIFTAG